MNYIYTNEESNKQNFPNISKLQILGDFDLKYLNSLENLKILSLEHGNELGDSLKGLINLEKLRISYYNHPLGDLLKGLINLKELSISNYNHPLGDSLEGLINLKVLHLDTVKDDIENSLLKLSKLEKLYIRLDRFPYSLKKLREKIEINMTLGYGKTPDNPECFR